MKNKKICLQKLCGQIFLTYAAIKKMSKHDNLKRREKFILRCLHDRLFCLSVFAYGLITVRKEEKIKAPVGMDGNLRISKKWQDQKPHKVCAVHFPRKEDF